jgi:hypothetical protein
MRSRSEAGRGGKSWDARAGERSSDHLGLADRRAFNRLLGAVPSGTRTDRSAPVDCAVGECWLANQRPSPCLRVEELACLLVLEVGEENRHLLALAFEDALGGEDLLGKVLRCALSGDGN